MQDERPTKGSLGEIGEDAIVEHLTSGLQLGPEVVVGPGDDCAVVKADKDHYQLLKTDSVIEQVHFLPDADPELVGWKAAARVVSDFAAMGGGQPEHALVTLIMPADRPLKWASELYIGIHRCAERFGFSVVGGETSRSPLDAPITTISVAMSGTIKTENCLLRSGAQVGDAIFVTGKLGGSISGKHLRFIPRIQEANWLTDHHGSSIHSMMDLSDGLAKDLPRLAKLSNVGFKIDRDQLPRNKHCTAEQALGDGEDYELLFTANSDVELQTDWERQFPDLPLTQVGTILPREDSDSLAGGWDPFAKD